jgi:peptide/nickel transport system substrate-binding protein
MRATPMRATPMRKTPMHTTPMHTTPMHKTLARILAAAAIALAALPARAETIIRYAPETLTRILDPHFSTSFQVRDFGYLVFDTLFAVNDRFEPQPQMVDTWTVSPDGLTYTFALRPGLLWHDGTPVKAEDCVASIRRWGSRDAMGAALMRATAELAAIDERSFRLVLREPFAFVLQSLGKVGAIVPFMMPKRLAETPGTEQVKEIVGSGPFRFVPAQSEPGFKLVVVRNDAYVPRREPPLWASGGKVAKVDRIELIAIPDPTTQVNALIKGEIDFIETLTTDLRPLVEGSKTAHTVDGNPFGVQALMRMNHLQPPFDDVRVRRAVAMAVDQERYMQATVGSPQAYKLCPAMMVCDTPYATAAGAPKRDIDAARRLIREAGTDLAKPVVLLHIANAPNIAPLGYVTAELLQSLGFKVDMQTMDFPTFAVRRLKQGPVAEGGWNIAHTTLSAPEVANPIASSPLLASGRDGWWGWAKDDEVERLRAAFAGEADPTRQKALAEAIQVRAYAAVLYLPLGQVKVASAAHNRLTGIVPAPMPVFWNIEKR